MNTQLNKSLLFLGIMVMSLNSFAMDIEKRGTKRTLENPSSSVKKIQKTDYIALERYFDNLNEQEKLNQFINLLNQTPSFKSNTEISQQDLEKWETTRNILEHVWNNASPQLQSELVKIALQNKNKFGVDSLIGFFAQATAIFENDNQHLQNVKQWKKFLAGLVKQADEQTTWEAYYNTITNTNLSWIEMDSALHILFEAGANPSAQDRNGHSIMWYLDNLKMPSAPLDTFESFRKVFKRNQ